MSQWLDEHRDLLALVARDLVRVGVKVTGRQGLPAEAVLRCALLKQYRQLSYQSVPYQTMPRRPPSRAILQGGAVLSTKCDKHWQMDDIASRN